MPESITINPARCGGQPCVRDTRMRVVDVLSYLAALDEKNQADFAGDFPDLTLPDIQACLDFGKRAVEKLYPSRYPQPPMTG